MDGFGQIGKYLKNTDRKADLALKRARPPQRSRERIRDIFDSEDSFKANINTPSNAFQVLVDFNFGRKLPALGCCGDCLCGITESYTSDSLIGSNLYVTTPYVPGSVVLYLNGVQGTKGVDYVESDPTTGQITVFTSSATFVVSYVYTVGNCTEAVCVDERFECIDYQFLSGVTTVFSDRFDRSQDVDPAGCGYYFNTTTFNKVQPSIANGEASFSTNTAAWLGGVDRLVGKTVEVIAAVNLDSLSINSTVTFALRGLIRDSFGTDGGSTTFDFTKLSSTTLRLRITFNTMIFERSDAPFTVIDTTALRDSGGQVETTITIEGGRYWFSMVQMENFAAAKAWPQFTTPPAAQVTGQMVDSFFDDPIHTDEINREWAVPTASNLRIQGSGIEAIMVGAGLDNGWWGIISGNDGATGYYCGEIPDGLIRFGYNCGVNGESTVTYSAVQPRAYWGVSYPHFIPPNGSDGRLIDYEQRVIAINTGTASYGHPTALRLKGMLVGSIWDSGVIAQIIQYPSGPLTMGGVNGFQGGQVLGSYQVPKDGTTVDFDVYAAVPVGEQYIRIGIHVPNLQGFATEQPFFFGSPTFPNNSQNSVQMYFLRAEAVQSVQCTTGPFCDDCTTDRCPELVDNFDTYTTTSAFGTGDYIRVPTQGAAFTNDKGTGTQVTYSGGVQTVSFQGTTQKFLNVDYNSPFDCNYTGEEGTWEAYFEVKIGTTTGTEIGTFAFGLIDIDYTTSGAFPASFGISPSYSSTNLTAGTWWSVRNQISGTDFKLKIWAAGTTEPDAWTFTSTVTSFPSRYVLSSFSSSNSSPTFTTQTRAVHITKVVAQ